MMLSRQSCILVPIQHFRECVTLNGNGLHSTYSASILALQYTQGTTLFFSVKKSYQYLVWKFHIFKSDLRLTWLFYERILYQKNINPSRNWHCALLSEDLVYSAARSSSDMRDPSQAGSTKYKTPFEFNKLSGTVGQVTSVRPSNTPLLRGGGPWPQYRPLLPSLIIFKFQIWSLEDLQDFKTLSPDNIHFTDPVLEQAS